MPDPATLGANPFAALTAVAGPAVLTNACPVLALGTSGLVYGCGQMVRETRLAVQNLEEEAPI